MCVPSTFRTRIYSVIAMPTISLLCFTFQPTFHILKTKRRLMISPCCLFVSVHLSGISLIFRFLKLMRSTCLSVYPCVSAHLSYISLFYFTLFKLTRSPCCLCILHNCCYEDDKITFLSVCAPYFLVYYGFYVLSRKVGD
jgi:hypothetical protein